MEEDCVAKMLHCHKPDIVVRNDLCKVDDDEAEQTQWPKLTIGHDNYDGDQS